MGFVELDSPDEGRANARLCSLQSLFGPETLRQAHVPVRRVGSEAHEHCKSRKGRRRSPHRLPSPHMWARAHYGLSIRIVSLSRTPSGVVADQGAHSRPQEEQIGREGSVEDAMGARLAVVAVEGVEEKGTGTCCPREGRGTVERDSATRMYLLMTWTSALPPIEMSRTSRWEIGR